MTELDLLLRAVIENPDEDTPRLEWADAFDEAAGRHTGRAEFVRVQVAMDQTPLKLPPGQLIYSGANGTGVILGLTEYETDNPEWARLKVSECELFNKIGAPGFFDDLPGSYRTREAKRVFVTTAEGIVYHFSRGFIEKITAPATTFFDMADRLFWGFKKCTWCQGRSHYLLPGRPYGGPISPFVACTSCDNGRVRHEFKSTFQPVTAVHMTTRPFEEEMSKAGGDIGIDWRIGDDPAPVLGARYGAEFTMAPERTIIASDWPSRIGGYRMEMVPDEQLARLDAEIQRLHESIMRRMTILNGEEIGRDHRLTRMREEIDALRR